MDLNEQTCLLEFVLRLKAVTVQIPATRIFSDQKRLSDIGYPIIDLFFYLANVEWIRNKTPNRKGFLDCQQTLQECGLVTCWSLYRLFRFEMIVFFFYQQTFFIRNVSFCPIFYWKIWLLILYSTEELLFFNKMENKRDFLKMINLYQPLLLLIRHFNFITRLPPLIIPNAASI